MKLDKLPGQIDPSLDLDEVRREAKAMVKKRAYISAGVSAVPVPFLDVMVDAGLLTQLIPEINVMFGLAAERMPAFDLETREVHWNEMRSRGLEFAGLVATRGVVRMSIQGMATRILSKQVIKFIPLGGQIVAATMGYYVMKKIATDHINECYNLAKGLQNKQSEKVVAGRKSKAK